MKRLMVISLISLFPGVVAVAQDYPYPQANYAGETSAYDHASTAQQGASQGVADVVRSNGENNLMTSAAAKNYEDARQKYIENRELAMHAYYQIKTANQQYRDSQRPSPPSSEQMSRINDSRRPDALSSHQLDQRTGAIRWPLALQDEQYREERERIEDLYTYRARQGGLTAGDYLEVKKLTGDMLAALQRQGDRLPGNVRIDARKILEGIAYEARLQASSPGLAQGVNEPSQFYVKAD